jgi:hypothetical protein
MAYAATSTVWVESQKDAPIRAPLDILFRWGQPPSDLIGDPEAKHTLAILGGPFHAWGALAGHATRGPSLRMSTAPENEFDLEKLFLPAWAQQEPSSNKYASYEGGEDRFE